MPSENYLQLKLGDLLKSHSEGHSTETLPDNLGDAYLFKFNPVFRKIRQQFLKMGYTLTQDDFCHYDVLPYASLPKILSQKKVPYKNNVQALQEIETTRPGRFTVGELVKVKSNYVLHESSLCIADSILEKITAGPFLSPLKITAESARVFKFIMAESFANAVESFANIYNKTPQGKLFYDLNSYVTHHHKINVALEKAITLLGERLTFDLIYISYLYSNCLLPEPHSKQLTSIFEVLIPDSDLRKKALDSPHVRKLFSHGFELSLDFRMQTTGFFCAFMGIDTPLEKLLRIDLLEILKKTTPVSDFLSDTRLFND